VIDRRNLIKEGDIITLKKQCGLLSLSRSSYYYEPAVETELNLKLMRLIDETYTECPFYGSRRITEILINQGYEINRKRIQRLMQRMGIKVIYPRPNLSKPDNTHRRFPYLLKGVKIEDVNDVWSTDITYIPMKNGFLYLVAVLDWFSRYVLTWKLSNNLESSFCIDVLIEALKIGKPKIFNSDQGTQFTSNKFLGILETHDVRISMDGKGRAFDNIFVERLWRTVKYEEVYCKAYESFDEAKENLNNYFRFYNGKRLHQSLGYKTPREIFLKGNFARL
jgi:putative transposase